MPKSIKGKEVLEALSEFKEPVTLDEIVQYVAETYSEPEEKVKKLVEEALNGGVRYGFVQKHNEYYYRVCDAIDAIEGSESEEDDEDDGLESAESLESVDSGDMPPEPKPKRGSGRAPSRQASKTNNKKVNKRDKERRDRKCMDVYSDEEEEEEEDEEDIPKYNKKRGKSHKCSSDCDGFHRKNSEDDYEHLRSRSRSASRRR